MNFKHACFISYRNGDRNDKGLDPRRQDIKDTLNAFARDLRDELKRELITQQGYSECLVFLDQDPDCFSGGDPLLSTLSTRICNSVCMIVVFTRHYLDKDKLTCAAELEGMLRRLDQRCYHFDGENVKNASNWIFTAVFREPDRVPDILKKNITFDFTAYDNSSTPLRDNPKFCEQIRVMAKKIADYWEELDYLDDPDLNLDHRNFSLLDPEADRVELLAFVKQHRKPFNQSSSQS
jgi:hypothetical protein